MSYWLLQELSCSSSRFWWRVFNALVRLRNAVKNAWSQIDVQLKRRHDLIPNLVETAKGYMVHERETLENVTKARNLAQNASEKGAGPPSRVRPRAASARH